MKVTPLEIEGVLFIEPKVFGDDRGFFLETWSQERYSEAGAPSRFVQDNLSKSRRGVLRGLHLQNPHGQGKLVSAPLGRVLDVAVDVRVGSPTFGRWVARELSEENHAQLYIPEGCAHGFCVLSEVALFSYKCTDGYHPECEMSVRFDDPNIGIEWPDLEYSLSPKDEAAPRLSDIPQEALPQYQG